MCVGKAVLLGGIVCLEICPRIYYRIYPKSILLKKNILKIVVSRNLRHAHLLEAGLTKIPRDHETLSIVHHVGLHVEFSSMKSSLDL